MLTDLRSLDLAGKKVLVRCDFNVPLENGAIADPGRVDASLETIRYILEKGGVAVLCSHLGRPKERDLKYTLKPVAEYLSEKLGMKVATVFVCRSKVQKMLQEEIAKLERPDPEETT